MSPRFLPCLRMQNMSWRSGRTRAHPQGWGRRHRKLQENAIIYLAKNRKIFWLGKDAFLAWDPSGQQRSTVLFYELWSMWVDYFRRLLKPSSGRTERWFTSDALGVPNCLERGKFKWSAAKRHYDCLMSHKRTGTKSVKQRLKRRQSSHWIMLIDQKSASLVVTDLLDSHCREICE